MTSLTPKHRSEEVTESAMSEGIMNAAMVMLPSMGGLYAAMQNATFRKVTNSQSRTALVIMPALFTFALTSELKMAHRMHEVAEETEHSMKSVEWAEHQLRRQQVSKSKESQDLRTMYRQAVMNSGIYVVDTPVLQTHHKVANFVQQNPFKCIAGIGLPAIGYIFMGQHGKEHLSLQLKILHTRVFGQAAVVCSLLGIMGLKEMMDRRYVVRFGGVEEAFTLFSNHNYLLFFFIFQGGNTSPKRMSMTVFDKWKSQDLICWNDWNMKRMPEIWDAQRHECLTQMYRMNLLLTL